MHYHGLRLVNHSVSLCPAPTGVFVVFGVLHFLQKPPLGPNVLSQATAYHAEEVFPVRCLRFATETPLVIMSKNRLTIRSGYLPAEYCGHVWHLQCINQRSQPVTTLWCSISIQKNP